MHTLLMVSLGPVQDFIASARRGQDLWFGSFMLSQLALAVAKGVQKVAGKDSLIFPTDPEGDAAANKIVAQVGNPHEAAQAGKDRMEALLKELANSAFHGIQEHPGFHRDVAMAHVQDLIEYAWVAVPIGSDYGEARRDAERLLSARKNTRTWEAVPWKAAPRVPKCSICGQRESVIDESLYDEAPDLDKARLLRTKFKVKGEGKRAERLCGVDLLKRLGGDLRPEESPPKWRRRPPMYTSLHVAAQPILTRIARMEARDQAAVAAYVERLAPLLDLDRLRLPLEGPGEHKVSLKTTVFNPLVEPYQDGDPSPTLAPRGLAGRQGTKEVLDGRLLFADRLSEVFEDYALDLAKSSRESGVKTARAALVKVFEAAGNAGAPSPYYALLLGDGDKMGNAIDGLKNLEQHQALSKLLSDIVEQYREIVELHGGGLVYAGGDDVMAFLPLHSALRCANELRRIFETRLKTLFGETAPTMSIGLGIGHFMDDLVDIRALARAAEELAKRSRNSLAIAVSKRSGGTLEVTGRWDENGPDARPLHERIDRWCRLLDRDELPDGVAFELEEEVAPFEVREPGVRVQSVGVEMHDVIVALTRRVIGRKRQQRGTEGLSKEVDNLLHQCFTRNSSDLPLDALQAVKALSAEIQIARVFLSAYQDAWGPLKEEAR